MSFTAEQKQQLAAPLSATHVKTRKQGGRQVSYVEGWQAISEANRIFGFDAWSRETVDFRCVSEKDREIGDRKDPGFGVTYTARVRVTVTAGDDQIIREGCGTGHGIDRDLGQAHESALKEAETDAMKRALMTFGNPFGLALYDKEQTNVEHAPAPASRPVTRIAQSGADVTLAANLKRQMDDCKSSADLDALRAQTEFKHAVNGLPEGLQGDVIRHGRDRRAKLSTPLIMAG
jgi:DNA recombination protein Rad52